MPEALSTESIINPEFYDKVSIDFGDRDPDAVATLIDQLALAINGQNFGYSVFTRNSNSVIGTVLDFVGIDVDDFLPNPSGVGFLGFVARDDFLGLSYVIDGTSDDDIMRGNGFDQIFAGGAGNDFLTGGGGDDTLSGGADQDTLEGGPGQDHALYSGEQHNYTLTLGASVTTLTDRRDAGDGTDTLIDMENIVFGTASAPANVNLAFVEQAALLSEADLNAIIELYIAYFDRAPDAVGLLFWAATFSEGLTLDQISSEFARQAETLATYPVGTTNAAFATSVYSNVLGRMPDVAGFDFWVGVLEQGVVPRDTFILRVLEGAKAPPQPDAEPAFIDQQNADRAYLQTKTDIGAYFAVHKGMSDVVNAADAMALFDGTEAGANSAIAAIDEDYANAMAPTDGEFLMPLVGVLDDPFII